MFALFQAFPSWALYKYLVHILKNSSAVENCTGARLGQVVSFLIFYNIWSSWLHTFHGFDFSFRWYDGENRQMGVHLSVKWDRKTRKVKSSHLLLRSLGQVNDLFSSTGLTVCVYIGGFWLLRFYGVHFTHDSQNSFSAHHDSPTANMVDGGIMKISYNQLQKYLRHCTVVWHKWPVHDLVLVIPPPPLTKVASNTRPYSRLGGTTLNGREEGGQYYILQTCDQERFEARKVVFPWECLIIFATGCSPAPILSVKWSFNPNQWNLTP